MKFYFRDRLSDGSLIKLAHNVVDCSYISDHHDYHPHFEVFYSHRQQEQNILLNSQKVHTVTPHVTIISPFTIHDMSPVKQKDFFEANVVFFSENFLRVTNDQLLPSSYINENMNCVFPLTDEQNERLYSIFSMMKEPGVTESERKACFLLFLNMLFRMVPPSARIRTEKTSNYITDVLDYIYQNISSISSASDLLSVFHVSFSKLNRDFKKHLGLSVHQVIVNYRCSKAIDMLNNTSMKIKDIAALCGFENEYYFYVFFKNQTGKTPSAFRNQNESTD